jgi:4'-phosphopantetheinyl transferase
VGHFPQASHRNAGAGGARVAWIVPWTPAVEVRLRPGDVQVWRASLEVGPGALAGLRAVLAEDERARADRLPCERERERFTVARAFLRGVLARHLGVRADRVPLRLQRAGKPELPGSRLRFNLSHSRDRAVVALTLGCEIGVDLEALRPVQDACAVAERYFTPREAARLRSVREADRDAAFLRCWTRKEAYVKGVGGGLGIRLDGFEVGGAPACAEATHVLHRPGGRAWTLRSFDPGPGYVGALAVQRAAWRLVTYDWRADPSGA